MEVFLRICPTVTSHISLLRTTRSLYIFFLSFLGKTTEEAKQETAAQTCEKSQKVDTKISEKTENVVEFSSQVSQDMSELVYHLNSIQNDISELAGRPISLTKLEEN